MRKLLFIAFIGAMSFGCSDVPEDSELSTAKECLYCNQNAPYQGLVMDALIANTTPNGVTITCSRGSIASGHGAVVYQGDNGQYYEMVYDRSHGSWVIATMPLSFTQAVSKCADFAAL